MEKKETPIWKRILLKVTSWKNIVCGWAMVMFTWMFIKGQAEFADLGWGLLVIISWNIGCNILQHKMENKIGEK